MGEIFTFSDINNSKKTIRSTWDDFRTALATGQFFQDEIDKAKNSVFLKVYDDLFHQHSGITLQTTTVSAIQSKKIGRGAILREGEFPSYERFVPKKEYITNDNRFSPPGVEWLYLAIGEDQKILSLAQAECRAKNGERFGFCEFDFVPTFEDYKLVDLTIADDITYNELNQQLENFGQAQVKKGLATLRAGKAPQIDTMEFNKLFTKWSVYTYAKLLAEQIFVPLNGPENKKIEYAPFQTMAQYYISLGYAGIIYGSTVFPNGRNLVLFDKKIALPCGNIEIGIVR